MNAHRETSDLSEYSDVAPVPFDQAPDSPFFIEFSPAHESIMRIFRGIANANELSPRALALTEQLLAENPNDSAVWWYRTRILSAIGFDPQRELELTDSVTHHSPKSYQCWQHRRWVLARMDTPPRDLSHLRALLRDDGRNFHAWSYAVWLSGFCGVGSGVLQLTAEFIDADRTNSSAWNARAALLSACGRAPCDELAFALAKLSADGRNESCCNHIRAVLAMEPPLARDAITGLRRFLAAHPNDRSALILLLHLSDRVGDSAERERICAHLIKIDSLRKRYWELVMRKDPRYA